MEINYGIDEIEQVAKNLIKNVKTKTLLFYGDMGVGKTSLIKALVKAFGSNDAVSSPSFSIVNEYKLGDELIYHFDLYRIEDIEELYNFGIEDYLDSNHWKLIEWPEKIKSLLDENFDVIKLKLDKNNNRIISLNKT
ncbi:tRNA (adenosine(37)-N6)-threonylcarbamoyltransferase complex ATPase subunit type 1 TsaE [uncultured Algibacter sp.]|uniref:tRNA (adenosine(37)-N6)-threonylcarbamoyltransferase complex ATPase subunit type 1 TsaE n=1 Tax=uncultured Algibacter sp. TaxID=298659 RepID=UPI0026194CD7|nr:tRNA (adenosine(37)-N6)-threonylcarbamoyltransferase complex ATPase subunit type 1 TsaE [uncultured Algibacter sp.]